MFEQSDFDAQYEAENKRQAVPGLYRLHAPDGRWLAVDVWYDDGERDEEGNLISDEVLIAAIWQNGTFSFEDPYKIFHWLKPITEEEFEELKCKQP